MSGTAIFNTTALTRVCATAEGGRLQADAARTANWKRWGPYLSERQWATVREDYSPDGTCWDYFPHDHARSRAYRWGEDGLLGFTDRECRLCFGLALWNGRDPILKERLFGLTGPEGSHGEDVKEAYFYLESTPTHSYCKLLYKYPQAVFPYEQLLRENRGRAKSAGEFELEHTGVFDEGRYFDVQAEYAKRTPDDLLIRLTLSNRGPETATLHLLPTVWFRNIWSWGCTHEGCGLRPRLARDGTHTLRLDHETLGAWRFEVGPAPDGSAPRLLFTENDSNTERLWGIPNTSPYVKDAFHRYLIEGKSDAVNPREVGTKAAPHYILQIPPGESQVIRLRLHTTDEPSDLGGVDAFDAIVEVRAREADDFYSALLPPAMQASERLIVRQAYAGLLCSKQFYHYVVEDWLKGDPGSPPADSRLTGRNHEWKHLHSRDVLSMPDKWEYPWFAAWDLAFHMIPFARVDPWFAKHQLTLMLREWYMHPNGQIPAYEFALGDVNPPVHAWAAWRVYKISGPPGGRDRDFLEGVFQKLLLNFTWWVNRKDATGRNLFSGGFLGLDNIGVFDRSKPLPTGGTLQQADGTAWMAFYCATMLSMSLELARDGDHIRTAYEDMASKFFEHFVQIVDAMNSLGGSGLWDETDGFYYDRILLEDRTVPLKTRSMVGLLPLIAVELLEEADIAALPGFRKRLEWFLRNRPGLARHVLSSDDLFHSHRLLAIPSRDRLVRVLRYMLDESEFLSPYGLRSVSRHHERHPFELAVGGEVHRVDYVPGESNTWLFGGNSNWRGPVWFPVNYLVIECLERYQHFYGDTLKVECPTGSGHWMNLGDVAAELSRRLSTLFVANPAGVRPCHGSDPRFANDPHWRDLVLFHEYFHAETGRGLGANHQTGWTALVIRHFEDMAKARSPMPIPTPTDYPRHPGHPH